MKVLPILLMGCFGFVSPAMAQAAQEPPRAGGSYEGLMTREQGLAVAREVAKAEGRDLARYQLDTFGEELTEDGSEWMFGFQCKPVPAPGCFFMVVVDRRTGSARLFPGE